MSDIILNNDFKCVLSIGQRCITEIILKELNIKKFSGPFDAMFNSSILNIVDLLENGIIESDLIYSECIKDNEEIESLHKVHGYRTINKKYDNIAYDDILQLWHSAFLPHHNLKKEDDRLHFDRCFKRVNKIKKFKIKTLFCLFNHRTYSNDGVINNNDIETLKHYLINNFNCHLLICEFYDSDVPYVWNIEKQNEFMTHIHINTSEPFTNDDIIQTIDVNIIKEILELFKIKTDELITYNEIEQIII